VIRRRNDTFGVCEIKRKKGLGNAANKGKKFDDYQIGL